LDQPVDCLPPTDLNFFHACGPTVFLPATVWLDHDPSNDDPSDDLPSDDVPSDDPDPPVPRYKKWLWFVLGVPLGFFLLASTCFGLRKVTKKTPSEQPPSSQELALYPFSDMDSD